jgi:hypothetical protein
LASFASVFEEEEEECVNLEYAACAGQGGSFECEYCDQNYKHLNCLQRHKWDHNANKQQQTQLLEVLFFFFFFF